MRTQAHPARRSGRRSGRRQPEVSRHAILQASLVEFAQEGLAGARMDAIAEAAGVNKALLYYYFHDKDTLYGAVLDRFFARLLERIMGVCDRPGTAGERFLSYVRTHFDSIAESPYYARIFMEELMSASRGGSPHLDRILADYMQPIGTRLLGLLQDGIRAGEFRAVDPAQFMPSAIGSIVHYFLTAPLRRKFMPELYPTTEKAIHDRRAAVLDFIAAALFADRDAGLKLAARIATADPETAESNPALPPAAPFDLAVARREGASQLSPARHPQRSAASAPDVALAPLQRPQPHDTSDEPSYQADSPPAQPRPNPGYRWMNRWFPDFETARKILQEEAEAKRRRRKTKKPRKRPATPGEEVSE
jgi:TetR/AcrR family transcriptional regulator